MLVRSLFISILTLTVSVLVSACGKENSSAAVAEGKIGNIDFKILNSAGLSFDASTLIGSGDVVAKLPLATNKDSGKNIALTFFLEDSGSLAVNAFSSASLENGINVVFTRSGSSLKAKTTHKDSTSQEKNLTLNASSPVSVLIDVHNDESPAHILIWNGTEATPSEENALFNTEKDAESAGQGTETFWGLSLSKAKIINASLSDTKYEHE